MSKKIFLISFVIGSLCQLFVFTQLGMYDMSMWADQAKFFETNNPIQFDYLLAYGHPGGPLIEGTLLIKNLFNVSYQNALLAFIVMLNGLAIGGISTLYYLLSKNKPWWILVFIPISINTMYSNSTPPSTVVAILIGFMCIYSIYLFQKNEIFTKHLVFLSFVFGLTVATRFDIGGVTALSMLIFLKPKISWKKLFQVIFASLIFFIILDPYMLFMPWDHLKDLWFKITYHYDDFAPTKMSFRGVFNISTFAFMSMIIGAVYLLFKEKISSPISLRFISVFGITTVLIYWIFMTSSYQSSRYFLPLTTTWLILLPILTFTLITQVWPKYYKKINFFLGIILAIYPIFGMLFSLYVYKGYNF